MKRKLIIVGLFLTLGAVIPNQVEAQWVIADIIKLVVKKVINAIDLAVQQVQNKTIVLQNAQKELENIMASLQLEDISNWVEKQRKLYEDYYRELWQVKQMISEYDQVKEIIRLQAKMVSEYTRTYSLFKQDKHFTTGELDQMFQVYTGMLRESLNHINQVLMVVNPLVTQMDDAARMEIIHQATNAVQKNYNDLLRFNHHNVLLSLQRGIEMNEAGTVKKLYGIP